MTPQDKPADNIENYIKKCCREWEKVCHSELHDKLAKLEQSNVRTMDFLAYVFEQVNPPLSDKVWDEIKRLKEL
jgi:hypothetical protein